VDNHQLLRVNTSIEDINLEYNDLGPEGLEEIIGALSVNTSLRQLRLRGNQLGAPGAELLRQLFTVNTSLEHIGLEHNAFQPAGALALAAALAGNSNLQVRRRPSARVPAHPPAHSRSPPHTHESGRRLAPSPPTPPPRSRSGWR
jgi:Ran GTPase-activating protein (RanGAP) involved in mRNA processing and transport